MTKLSLTFKQIYSATEEALKKIKEPFVVDRNKRAFASAISSAEEQGVNARVELEKLLSVVKDGETINLNEVLKQVQIIEDAELTSRKLKELRDQFFRE
jgi:hypothetical protein